MGSSKPGIVFLEEDLPSEIADNELAEVESIRDKELLRKENQIIGKKSEKHLIMVMLIRLLKNWSA